MASEFGWMDHDDSQRRRMLAAIELFKDDGTVDELGVGAVRDTIANALFPGVSVLHTRARYLLFVPWCLKDAVSLGLSTDAAAAELRKREIRVIDALVQGDPDQDGLIGRVARHGLKRMPSAAYWSVLGRWGIRTADTSIVGFIRDASVAGRIKSRQVASEDPEAGPDQVFTGFDPDLPRRPDDLYKSTSFALTAAESDYLSDRWRMSAITAGSLLPWTLDHEVGLDADDIWLHPHLETAPDIMRELVEHGHRFSRLVHGAALMYNLLLADALGEQDERSQESRYRERLTDWHTGVRAEGLPETWDSDVFWAVVRRRNPGLARSTQLFVDRWIDCVLEASSLADNPTARQLVSDRERTIKGGRARLFNASALQHWQGESGLVQLDYNWRVARRLARDVLAGAAV